MWVRKLGAAQIHLFNITYSIKKLHFCFGELSNFQKNIVTPQNRLFFSDQISSLRLRSSCFAIFDCKIPIVYCWTMLNHHFWLLDQLDPYFSWWNPPFGGSGCLGLSGFGCFFSALLNLADVFSAPALILVGGLSAAVANASLLLVRGFWGALLMRCLVGLGLSLVYPPSVKLLSTWYSADKRSAAMGFMFSFFCIGTVLCFWGTPCRSVALLKITFLCTFCSVPGNLRACASIGVWKDSLYSHCRKPWDRFLQVKKSSNMTNKFHQIHIVSWNFWGCFSKHHLFHCCTFRTLLV